MSRTNRIGHLLSRRFHRRGACSIAVLVLTATVSTGRAAAVHAEDAVIEITEAVWTDNVKATDKQYVTQYEKAVPLRTPLYFWTRVSGRAKALERLRADGKLPIRHDWLKLLGPEWIYDNTADPLDAIPLSVGRDDQIAQLQLELQHRTFFDWRTWSKKDNITRGWWRVSVRYADGEDVICANKPCRYLIEVR